MSTFSCPIVEIGKLEKHANADTLSIVHIYSYPVIVRTGELNEGDKAIYIPEEALVPEVPMFSFLWKNREKPREKDRVIRAIRLRGIFSMGLLIPVPQQLKDLPVGSDVAIQLGIEKYEKPEPVCTGGSNLPTPGWFHKYTEIEQLRKYNSVLTLGEEVVITEKIHGSNGRFCYHDNQLWVGSHNNTKENDGLNMWWVVANQLNLEERLRAHPDIIIFGEVYGQVQKGFDYDVARGKMDLILFDAFDVAQDRYLNYYMFLTLAQSLELKVVPILYRGPWLGLEQHEPLADGLNALSGKHIREGFVVKPVQERWNEEVGRVILKLVGQEYLLNKHKE